MDAGTLSPVGNSASEDPRREHFDGFASSDDEDESFGITFTTSETKCDDFYEQGVALASRGQHERALESFLAGLKKMQECQYFSKLPQTLKQLAAIYHNMGESKRAMEFAQAEKLFYEAVITDDQDSARDKNKYPSLGGSGSPAGKRLRKARGGGWAAADVSDYAELLIGKADEYEKLSRHCDAENQFPLALDYCGKAVNIRQSVLGSEHPHTLSTMDQFSVLCAKVEKIQPGPAIVQPTCAICTDVETTTLNGGSVCTENSTPVENCGGKADDDLKCESKPISEGAESANTVSTKEELELGVLSPSVDSYLLEDYSEDCASNTIVNSKTFTAGDHKCGMVLSYLSSIPVWLMAATMVVVIVLFV